MHCGDSGADADLLLETGANTATPAGLFTRQWAAVQHTSLHRTRQSVPSQRSPVAAVVSRRIVLSFDRLLLRIVVEDLTAISIASLTGYIIFIRLQVSLLKVLDSKDRKVKKKGSSSTFQPQH